MPETLPKLWACRDRRFDLQARTHIMGVVNVTPDSFSDGGDYLDSDAAIAHALKLWGEGADLLDIGGESTRPGAAPVGIDDELARVIPVIQGVLSEAPDAPISIDTSKLEVAEAALEAGAVILNDVTAGRKAPGMFDLAAETGAGLILMHMQGDPGTMQEAPEYEDVVCDVIEFLGQRLWDAVHHGVRRDQIMVDPGIGFGKTLEHNVSLLRGVPCILEQLQVPVLVGLSRKRMIAEITGRGVEDRLAGSLAGMCAAIQQGAQLIRVHDVKESVDAARVIDRIR